MPNSVSDDATPTYRGYRRQALYALSCILAPAGADGRIYQPEGVEDLAIYDATDRLVEVVQVKDLSVELSLSAFSANKANSFFFRVAEKLEVVPDLRIVIVSFGPIGPELCRAITAAGKERIIVAKKLSASGRITELQAEDLLEHIEVRKVDEDELTKQVYEMLQATLAGVDPHRAFENLNYWLYLCSETKCKLSYRDVIDRIVDIGRFLAERTASHQEWFTSIVPLTDDLRRGRDELAEEYYRGIGARYEHILATLDVIRQEKLREISDKLSDKRVIIIHGASGQGKTTLAYRFLHDFFPDDWRFFIRTLEGREHALRVARAVSGHARAVGVSVAVYVDVTPSDRGWEELIKDLSTFDNIRVLVTIREEDWRRSTVSGADLIFEPMELTLQRNEAREIYEELIAKRASEEFLSFADAWEAFDSQGPLLEFVYLVTQGASLRERLAAQLQRIEEEVNAGIRPRADLDLLRAVSVASVFEARLKIAPLVESLQLPAPSLSLRRMEKEYLLRVAEDRTFIQGLHPVRSAIVAELLVDPALVSWTQATLSCLPFIVENDIEVFLLHAFSHADIDSKALCDALMLLPSDTWVATIGVVRALLWLGLRDYTRANGVLIEQVHKEVGSAWSYVLDYDLMSISTDSLMSLWQSDATNPVLKERIKSFRSSQTDKHDVQIAAKVWLASRRSAPQYPISEADWAALAETLYWLGRLDILYPFPDWLPGSALSNALSTVTLDTLADLALGIFSIDDDRFTNALLEIQPQLLTRFKQETHTASIEDDGQVIRAHFLVPIELLMGDEPKVPIAESIGDLTDKPKAKDALHDEGIRRVSLLRRLVPNRESFGCQGYGHAATDSGLFDSTEKRAIPKHLLPPRWAVTVNATFRGLGDWTFRPRLWSDYTERLLVIRRAVVTELSKLEKALETYFATKRATDILGTLIDRQEWDHCHELLRNLPLFPRCAVDEWGFSSEGNDNHNRGDGVADRTIQRRGLALQRYMPLSESLTDYTRALGNFFGQAPQIMALNAVLGRQVSNDIQYISAIAATVKAGIDPKLARLSVVNLSGGLNALLRMQTAFRHFLSSFVNGEVLDDLDHREAELLTSALSIWYRFAFHPDQVLGNATHNCLARYVRIMREARGNLQQELRSLSTGAISVSILSETILWDNTPTLCLAIDGADAVATYSAVERVLDAVRNAISQIEPSELRRLCLEAHWPYVVVIPLLSGKLLQPRAWRFSLPVLLSTTDLTSLKPWNYILQAIPEPVIVALDMQIWEDSRLDPVAHLLERVGELAALIRYLANLRELPTLQDDDVIWFQSYVNEVAGRIGETITEFADTEGAFLTMIQALLPIGGPTQPDITDYVQSVATLNQLVLPSPGSSGTYTISVDACNEWVGRLEKGIKLAALIYWSWASYTIGANNRK